MIKSLPQNYSDLIDFSTDNQTCIVDLPAIVYLDRYESIKEAGVKKDIEVAKIALGSFPNISLSDKHFNDALMERLSLSHSMNNDRLIIEFKLTPVLCLSDENPAHQIASLKEFIDEVKSAIERMHEENENINFPIGFALSTSDKKMTLVAIDHDNERLLSSGSQMAKKLNEMLDQSPILTAWKNETLKMMAKEGRYAVMPFTESILFHSVDSPIYKKIAKKTTKP